MKIRSAKMNMVKQQIRTSNVLNDKILDLFMALPREDFVPAKYRRLAFADTPIPIGHHQFMMSPEVEAKMLSALNLKPSDKVLEIGTGTGYVTALLAKACHHVYSVDLYPDFLSAAEHILLQLNINNVTLQEGNAAEGWDLQQPYDVICITGSLPVLPTVFREQLTVGGRLFVVLGQAPVMEALLITRELENVWVEKKLFETNIPPLQMAIERDPFTF